MLLKRKNDHIGEIFSKMSRSLFERALFRREATGIQENLKSVYKFTLQYKHYSHHPLVSVFLIKSILTFDIPKLTCSLSLGNVEIGNN